MLRVGGKPRKLRVLHCEERPGAADSRWDQACAAGLFSEMISRLKDKAFPVATLKAYCGTVLSESFFVHTKTASLLNSRERLQSYPQCTPHLRLLWTASRQHQQCTPHLLLLWSTSRQHLRCTLHLHLSMSKFCRRQLGTQHPHL